VGAVICTGVTPARAEGQAETSVEPRDGIIEEIRFVGNKRTRRETLLQEMVVGAGDPADPDRIELSRQAIMDLELFKSVETELQPGADGQILTIVVKEKRYFFVLPVLSRSGDGDVSYGAQARFDNLWGRNHRLKLEVKKKELSSDADVDEEKTAGLEYDYPRIAGGPWELDTRLRTQEALLEENRDGIEGDYERDTTRIDVLASRWKRPVGPSRGWRYGGGLSYQDFKFDFIEGDPTLFFDTTELGLLGRLDYYDVRAYEFNRSGQSFRYTLDLFSESLGSKKNRRVHGVRYRRYELVTRRRHTNLNYQFRVGWTNESLFGDPTFSVTGSTRLRGYDRDSIEGNAFALLNLEFLSPIGRFNTFRGVAFVDIGDAFPEAHDFTLADLKVGAGLGLRWRIRAFVRVDLRLDVAYGFDEEAGGDTKVYASSESTF
jgi:outer membrane protein assembly factor BamA